MPHSLNRRTWRPLRRHHSRMLGGARRPRPINHLALYCRAMNELMKIDKRLRPYMEEQIRFAEDQKWRDSREAALRAVYGPSTTPPAPPLVQPPTAKQIAQLIKDEKALAKTQIFIAQLQAKLHPHNHNVSPTFQSAWPATPAFQSAPPVTPTFQSASPADRWSLF